MQPSWPAWLHRERRSGRDDRIGSPGVLHQAQALIDGLGAEGAAGLASVVGQLLAPAPNRAPRRVKRKVPA